MIFLNLIYESYTPVLGLLRFQGLDLFSHGCDVLRERLNSSSELVHLSGLLLALELVVVELLITPCLGRHLLRNI